MFSAPQFPVSAGGSIQKGDTNQILQIIGGIIIAGLELILVGSLWFAYSNYEK